MLSTIDGQLARSGTPPEGLEDLKKAVDSLRTSVWAILSAGRSANYKSLVERFRLRRALDTNRGIVADIDAGITTTLLPEHTELQILAQQLFERIGHLKPGP
jgi:hypothetical protein